MLWPDWKKRAKDLLKMSDFFREGNYVETSNRIEGIIRHLKMTKLDKSRFRAELGNVFSTFRREFTQDDKFRQECFQEIESITASALLEEKAEFYNKLLELYPLIRRQREPSEKLTQFARFFWILIRKDLRKNDFMAYVSCI